MPGKSEHFRCPLCGQHAPIERLEADEPFELAQFEKTLGGKAKLSPEDREERIALGSHKETFRGSAPGLLEYKEARLSARVKSLALKRIKQLQNIQL